MSHIKHFLEEISVELGFGGEINEHVLLEGNARMKSYEHQVAKGDKYDNDQFSVPMDGQVLSYLRCLVERDVQNFYDDPEGLEADFGPDGNQLHDRKERLRFGIAMQLDMLRKAAAALHLDWDEVVALEATQYEIKRVEFYLSGNE